MFDSFYFHLKEGSFYPCDFIRFQLPVFVFMSHQFTSKITRTRSVVISQQHNKKKKKKRSATITKKRKLVEILFLYLKVHILKKKRTD